MELPGLRVCQVLYLLLISPSTSVSVCMSSIGACTYLYIYVCVIYSHVYRVANMYLTSQHLKSSRNSASKIIHQ